MSTFNFSGSGGVLVNGTFIGTEYYFFTSGGVVLGGVYFVENIINFYGSGGVGLAGKSDVLKEYNLNLSGGVVLGGVCFVENIINFYGSGGVDLAGKSDVLTEYNLNLSGGVFSSGSSTETTVYHIVGNGGVEINGESIDSQVRTFSGSGGVDLAGDSYAVRLVVFSGSGGVINAGKVTANIVFNPTSSGGVVVYGNSKDRILFNSTLTFPISFDLGDLPIYAYRVTGYCQPLNCDTNFFSDPQSNCGHQIVNYVLARSLSDLCTQLNNYDYLFRVKAVYKYDKAVLGIDNLNDIQNGLVDPNCPKFEDVTDEFCLQTECFEFCLNQNSIFLIKAIFTAEVYVPNISKGSLQVSGGYKITSASFYSYSAVGNYKFNGNAVASGNNLIPNVIFVGSGKEKITGGAIAKSSYLGIFSVIGYGDISAELISIDTLGGQGLTLEGDTLNPVANICGCKTLLNYVDFQTNLFTKNSIFSNFAYRNNLNINKNLRLYYNQKTKTFFNSVKFEGLSVSSNDTENWNIIVELACTNQVSRFNDSLWNFSLFVSKKTYGANNVLKNNLETRFYVYIPYVLLYTDVSLLEFDLQIDIKNMVVYNKFKQIIYDLQPRLAKDNIKLFSSGDWVNNPYLNIFAYSITNNLDYLFKPNRNANKINILPLV